MDYLLPTAWETPSSGGQTTTPSPTSRWAPRAWRIGDRRLAAAYVNAVIDALSP